MIPAEASFCSKINAFHGESPDNGLCHRSSGFAPAMRCHNTRKHTMKTTNLAIALSVLAALALSVPPASAETPDKFVNYVEATGTQWVDPEIDGRWNTKIEAKVEWMNIADSGFIGCGDWEKSQRVFMCYMKNANGEMLLSMGENTVVTLLNGWNSRFEKNRIYDYTAEFSATNGAGQCTGTVTVDGIGPWSKTYTALNPGRSLYVFANNQKDNTVNGYSRTRCYGLKIYQGTIDGGDMVLVRDFRPCMKDNRAGLYDDVSKRIFYSGSGTDLVCDENCDVPDEFIDYVESQGVAAQADGQLPAYIDTGIIGKAGTIAEFKETCLKTTSGEYCLLGALGSSANSRFYMWFQANGDTLGLGYENSYWRPNVNNPDATSSQGASDVYTMSYGDTTHALVSFAAGLQTFSVIDDNTGATNLVSRKTISANVNTEQNLYLFARNNNGTPNVFCASRLYGLKIWQDGHLVRDFKPCLKNGVAGLYDDISKRIFYSSGTPLAFNNVYRQSVKPKEVVFVEYIESDGNNTLDTGVRARTGTRAQGVMMWTAEDENGGGKMRTYDREASRYLENTAAVFWRAKRAYLGARNVKNQNAWFHMLHESNAILLSQYGNSGETALKNGGANVPASVGVTNSFDVTFADGSQTMEWNGVQVLSTNLTGSVDTGNNLCLFSSSHWRWRSAARCYGLQIWQDNTLVRDFRPCKVDGKGMLYDTVTESIYRPSPDIPESRTGKVIFPEGVTKPACYVDYVETDGTIFIDTGVIGKSGTTAEFKETNLMSKDGEQCFLGSYGGSSNPRFYFWYHAWGYTLGIAYGDYYRPKKNDQYTDAANSSDPDVYKLNKDDTTHARVSFAVGSQTFSAIDDATGSETPYSSKTLSSSVDTGRTLYLFAKNDNNAGTPSQPAESRFYFLKIKQGDADGSNMHLVRNFKPVKLTNGLVVLWDFVNDEPYVPKSTTAPYYDTTFPVVGPDGARVINEPFVLIVR